jgi:hypothetical protein
MRKFCIPAIVAACLFALPALAATAATSDSATTTLQNALPAPAATATTSDSASTTPQNTMQIQEQLRQDLSKAGYSDIQIMPGSFLVRAKDKQGNQTEMMISPTSMTKITAVSPSGSATQSGSGATQSGSSATAAPISPTSK